MNGPASPFAGHLIWVVRTLAYREPDYEEWSEDGAILYECLEQRGDFLRLLEQETGNVVWISLVTVAEVRLECENRCVCDDCAAEESGPQSTPVDPSRN